MANETQNFVHYITFRLAIFNFMNVQKHYGVKKSTQSTALSECGTWKKRKKKNWLGAGQERNRNVCMGLC